MQSFEIIANKIQAVLPKDWEKTVFYAEVSDDSYEMFYYVFIPDRETPIQCYELPNLFEITEEAIDNIFEELYEPLIEEQQALVTAGKAPWTNYTLVLNSDGSFKVDYDFTLLDNLGYEYRNAWKSKYLISLDNPNS